MSSKRLKIFISGHKGMVGSALVRLLKDQNVDIIIKDKSELDLLNQRDVKDFLNDENIDQVYMAAAKVGGIAANNNYPAEFIYENLMIQNNIIHHAFKSGIKKLLFIGSSCIYPKNSTQPISEAELLSGKLESTNEPYAIAKIAGIKMCEGYNRQYGESHKIDFRSLMPTNLYGPGDNYDPDNSHVIPGLIHKFHQAKIKKLQSVEVWGTGMPKREFLYVDDMARASIFFMNLDRMTYTKQVSPMCSHINVGSGNDLTIKDLAYLIKDIVGYSGMIYFDPSKPDGTPRKLLDSKKIFNLGFRPRVSLIEGLKKTYQDYLK